MNPKKITDEHIAKSVKSGNVEQLEIATLMGKGKQIIGKASWNDAARTYIKNVPNVMDDLEAMFKSVAEGDVEKAKSLFEKNKKYVFARDNQGRTPMHVAAFHGDLNLCKSIAKKD